MYDELKKFTNVELNTPPINTSNDVKFCEQNIENTQNLQPLNQNVNFENEQTLNSSPLNSSNKFEGFKECEKGEEDYSRAQYYSPDPEQRKAQLMERLKLKSKIIQYQETFPKQLLAYNYKMDKLDNFTNEDLAIFLDEIKIAVRQRNSLSMTKSLYFGGCEFVEKLGSKIGYNIKGFKNVLYGTEEIHNCLNEIALEYEDSMHMPASVRLPFITFQVAMSLYEVRNTERILNSELNKPIKKEVAELYEDL